MIKCNILRKTIYQGYYFLSILKRLLTQYPGRLHIRLWNFLVFGKSIISWIKTFNNNVKLSMNQCGNLSSFFSIGRGCRQGDLVSTLTNIVQHLSKQSGNYHGGNSL